MSKVQARKKILRLAVEAADIPDELASLDTLIFRHLEQLSAIGGDSEWLRNAVRNHFVRERLAASDQVIGKRVEGLFSRD